jgi:hypothetical protein
VVWQKDRELRRACCYPRPWLFWEYERAKDRWPNSQFIADRWTEITWIAEAFVLAHCLSGKRGLLGKHVYSPQGSFLPVHFGTGPTIRVGLSHEVRVALGVKAHQLGEKEGIREAIEGVFPGLSLEEVMTAAAPRVAALHAEMSSFLVRWAARYRELEALDQLFIAV